MPALRITACTIAVTGLATWTLAPVDGSASSRRTAPDAPRQAAIEGHGHYGQTFRARVRRVTNRRWCATVVVITVDTSSGTPVRYEWQPGRGCGTIAARNIAAVSFGCPTAAGIAGVVRGRPDRIVIVGADGRERAVQVRRIRDRYQAGTSSPCEPSPRASPPK